MWGERGTQTSRARLIACSCLWGLGGHHQTYKGISGLPIDPLEDTVGQACPRCLCLSLEGANPELSRHLPAETMMKAKLCPARTTPTTTIVPLPVLVYPSCFLPHFPGCLLRKCWPWAGSLNTHPSPCPTCSESRETHKTIKYFTWGSPVLMQEVTDPKCFSPPQLAYFGA